MAIFLVVSELDVVYGACYERILNEGVARRPVRQPMFIYGSCLAAANTL